MNLNSVRSSPFLLVGIILLMGQQNCTEEKIEEINCVEGLDVEQFHFNPGLGTTFYYYRIGATSEREPIGNRVDLILFPDNDFSIFIRIPCDSVENMFPICELADYEKGNYEIRSHGTWEFTQSYRIRELGNRRMTEFEGEIILHNETSSIEGQSEAIHRGKYFITCDEWAPGKYAETNFKFRLPTSDTLDIIFYGLGFD